MNTYVVALKGKGKQLVKSDYYSFFPEEQLVHFYTHSKSDKPEGPVATFRFEDVESVIKED